MSKKNQQMADLIDNLKRMSHKSDINQHIKDKEEQMKKKAEEEAKLAAANGHGED